MLRIDNLTTGYGAVEVVHGVSLAVPKGSVIGIVGANGAGKTALLQAICGLLSYTGTVRLEGRDIADLRAYERARAGMMLVPEAKRVEVATAPDRAAAIKLLDERRPVVALGLDPDEIVALGRRDDLTLHRVWAGHVSIEINFTEAPFDSRLVRHALAHATPYGRIRRDGLLGLARPWFSPAKRTSQWSACDHHRYDHDPAQARALLARAGFGSGFAAELHLDRRPDCLRMAEIIREAWAEVGIELTLKDVAELPAGRLPPLLLRTDCAHNLSEPVYDIAHDYAAMSDILPPPGGRRGVGTWNPRWEKNPEALDRFAGVLTAPDGPSKRQRFDALQSYLVEFSSSIFLAEVQFATACNRFVPGSLFAPEARPFHALHYQNCLADFYLPNRAP